MPRVLNADMPTVDVSPMHHVVRVTRHAPQIETPDNTTCARPPTSTVIARDILKHRPAAI